jgi:Lon protease-like protein
MVDKVLERYEDGRFDILVRGVRRFHVRRVDTERSFLRGEVEFFGDEPSEEAPAPAVARRALAAYLEYAAAAGLKEEPPSLEAPELSFRLAEASPDLDFRQFLLDLTSEYERLRFTTEHFERGAARRKLENVMKRTARHNGHGKHLGALSD